MLRSASFHRYDKPLFRSPCLPPLLSGVVYRESWIHFPSFLLSHVSDILKFGLKFWYHLGVGSGQIKDKKTVVKPIKYLKASGLILFDPKMLQIKFKKLGINVVLSDVCLFLWVQKYGVNAQFDIKWEKKVFLQWPNNIQQCRHLFSCNKVSWCSRQSLGKAVNQTVLGKGHVCYQRLGFQRGTKESGTPVPRLFSLSLTKASCCSEKVFHTEMAQKSCPHVPR